MIENSLDLQIVKGNSRILPLTVIVNSMEFITDFHHLILQNKME